MEKEKEPKANETKEEVKIDEKEETEDALELILFQVPECYVYLIPPRKSAASYRADEWNVNKWAWEGTLKVISKGEECIIRLEDKSSGELYARAFLRNGEPHPVEPVIDSSRYFVLRIEENIGGRLRHAFIGIGFRERTEAYDFQAALHDHMKYLNKKKTAEEMEQQFQKTSSSVDYSLKEGETLVLQLKNKGSSSVKSKVLEQGVGNLSLEDKGKQTEPVTGIKLPPPPPAPLSPVASSQKSPTSSPTSLSLEGNSKHKAPDSAKEQPDEQHSPETQSTEDIMDDDFGDFQVAG
ncbi:Adaptin ear-binding coat-associated protein 1 NECAP-1 [Corchorus capsularis]|uniref:Adaptin ear-binding coat-associated protein 1 NECAP-1 n=1 Tax=Corchorus capsularis TaxID=210143 RepID=A0A1R3J6A8_COCAP|nr:Adaptin ear-binding coat-associated protein 1 NECAP-1 [Corchorus capsularis]